MKMNNFSIYNMYLTICKNLSVPPSTVACPPSKKFLVTALTGDIIDWRYFAWRYFAGGDISSVHAYGND